MITAERQAEKNAFGLFSNGDGLPHTIDMTGDNSNRQPTKGLLTLPQRKGLLNTLKQNGRMEGIVEFITYGSRFRVHILNNNWIISFVLSSIDCPRDNIETINFSKEHFLQR